MNNKILLQTQTYDPSDITSVGYGVTLYGDGSIALEKRNRWQGAREGERWRSKSGFWDIEEGFSFLNFIKAEIESLTFNYEKIEDSPNWKKTNNGYIVK